MQSAFEKSFGITEATAARIRKTRKLKDQVARAGISLGGISVIVAICLIFFYLLYEVIPLFLPANVEKAHELAQVDFHEPVYSVMEEQAEVGLTIDATGQALFYKTSTGQTIDKQPLLEVHPGQQLLVSRDAPSTRRLAVATTGSQEALVIQHQYRSDFDAQSNRTIVPGLEYPYGESAIQILPNGQLQTFAFRDGETELSFLAVDEANQVILKQYEKTESFMSDGVELEELNTRVISQPREKIKKVLLSLDQRWAYVLLEGNSLQAYNLAKPDADPIVVYDRDFAPEGVDITVLEFLLGGYALLAGDSKGTIREWFLVRDKENRYTLELIRSFQVGNAPITVIETEHRRKGFIAGDSEGTLGLYNATAEREALKERLFDNAIEWISVAPRGNAILLKQAGGPVSFWKVDNKHPEVSWSSMWNKVWYENYEKPDYVWQSSSSSNDFEPKYSLMPLTLGTLKAAFYAMLMAMPLAICGAIYTAYFMAPELRTKVKPAIELMEALPTVILGFLAGLWLAPLVESNLPGVLSIFIITPALILFAAFGFSKLPTELRNRIPEGWVPVLLVPVVLVAGFIAMGSSHALENAFFGGDMRLWLTQSGIDFDQRNSLVVGIAMGFAVIPTIFSITEDAIFAVPKALSFGSLALGATPWQTLVRVVIPTASPGIFSAVMIGLGRAVGETMIVLMATGNTPIMDMNIFEGFRTLSANIAVEMPEAEVDSSHFRILFLSGLVLFVFTFMLNTTAEVVRQRLRNKYGSL